MEKLPGRRLMISSSHNPKIQQLRALLARRQAREDARAFVIEGVRLVEEALKSGWQVQLVLYTREVSSRGKKLVETAVNAGIEVEEVLAGVFDSISETETAQGIMATVSIQSLLLPSQANFLLVLDNLRDPGNLGALLRSAEAAGAQAAILTPGTVDAFSPKVVRSAMGAHFRLPIHTMTWAQIEEFCHANQSLPLKILVAEGSGGVPCWQTDLRQPLALVIGSEAQGVGDQARAAADGLIAVPMPGSSESLNAAVAGSILLFEVVRQRSS
jgi:RNA methyltransferase, TrmH family